MTADDTRTSLPAERPAPRPRTARSPRARGGHSRGARGPGRRGLPGLRFPRLRRGWHTRSASPGHPLALHRIVSPGWGRGKQGRETYLRATKPAHGYRLLRSGGARGPRPPAAAGAPRRLRVTPGAAPPGPVTRPPHTDRPRHGRRVKGAAPRDPRPAGRAAGAGGLGTAAGRARHGAAPPPRGSPRQRLPAGEPRAAPGPVWAGADLPAAHGQRAAIGAQFLT